MASCSASDGHIYLIDSSNASYPKFCISKHSKCKGGAVTAAFGYQFSEITSEGEFIKDVWVIFNNTNSNIKIFEYGKVPNGWSETMKAQPLEVNKYYRIGGSFVYTCDINSKCKTINLIDVYNNKH